VVIFLEACVGLTKRSSFPGVNYTVTDFVDSGGWFPENMALGSSKLKSTNSPLIISLAVTGGNDTVGVREVVSDKSEVLVPVTMSLGAGGG